MAAGKRLDNEKFDDYRNRLKSEAMIQKIRNKGIIFWNSTKKGTYIKNRSN